MKENYIAQRLAAMGTDQSELEILRAENAQLKQQIGQAPLTNFKSEAQMAFESSPEFEQILNTCYLRFIRDKLGAEFRGSPYAKMFQEIANGAFSEFEKNNKKEAGKNAQTSKKGSGSGETDAGKND